MAESNLSIAAGNDACLPAHHSLYQHSDEEDTDMAARIMLSSSRSGSLYYTHSVKSTIHTSLHQDPNEQIANAAARMSLPNSKSGSLYYTRCSDPSESAISIERQATAAQRDSSGSVPSASSMASIREGFSQSEDIPLQNYWQQMEPLFRCLPHLKSIGPSHMRWANVGTVTCIDYHQGLQRFKSYDSFKVREIGDQADLSQRIVALRNLQNDKIVTRVILVEDMCPDLIESLGSTFQIDPEFFAEHLNRSGYASFDYAAELPKHWQTRHRSKTYAVMKWYRPVLQNPTVTQWLQTPGVLLDGTMIGKKAGGRMVQGSIKWTDPSTSASGTPIKDRMFHEAMVDTNVFRRSWPLSTRQTTKQEEHQRQKALNWRPPYWKKEEKLTRGRNTWSDEYGGEPNLRDGRAIPTAWEEKASCFRYETDQAPISMHETPSTSAMTCHKADLYSVVILLDPLPAISDHQSFLNEPAELKEREEIQQSEPAKIVKPVRMSIPMMSRTFVYLPSNKFHATVDEIERFRESTETVAPTLRAVQEWAGTMQLEDCTAFRSEPILALLQTAHLDSKAFFDSVENTLDEIKIDSLDDYLMTKQLENWRQLMSDLEIEIPTIGQSLKDFACFAFRNERSEKGLPSEILSILDDLDAKINRAKSQLEAGYTALRADMQFSENRRSIREARSVGKLTELAFFFIPLSFTCSLFSTSIDELKNGVPAWVFGMTAVLMALISYIVRLFVYSDFIVESSRSALETFWKRRDVRRGQRAPHLTLILLTVQEVLVKIRGSLTVILTLAFVATPLALMWTTTKLDTGFNVAMTLLLVFSGFACFLLVGSALFEPFRLLLDGIIRRSHKGDAVTSSSTSGISV